MITSETYWQVPRRDVAYAGECTDEIKANAVETVRRGNIVIALYEAATGDKVEHVNSGWRPKSVNDVTPNASKTSWHLVGKAVDLRDNGDVLDKWLDTAAGEAALEQANVWREHPSATHWWCHLQTEPPRGWQPGMSRTFYP